MRYISFFTFILLFSNCESQNKVSSDLDRLFTLLKSTEYASVTGSGEILIDSVYVGKTLEKEGEESLVLNLCEFDCLTFVEHFTVFSILRRNRKLNENQFRKLLTKIRYRDGVVEGYTSRLHYFSDWIKNGVDNGWLEDITCDLGGVETQFHVTFMSDNPQYYQQLVADSTLIPIIKDQERSINNRAYCVIPQEKIVQIENQIKSGDIIGFVTSIKGLDYAHNGIAINVDGKIRLMHASSDYKKVRITEETLSEYVLGMSHMTGISVLRLSEGCKY